MKLGAFSYKPRLLGTNSELYFPHYYCNFKAIAILFHCLTLTKAKFLKTCVFVIKKIYLEKDLMF